MPATATSEARILANRKNSAKSTGPKTAEGKARSRQNGLKHGMTGSGVVLAEEAVSEVDRRSHALMNELDPQSTLGRVLVGQLAALSVRMERSSRQEEAAIATRVRHAAEVFDQERHQRAEQLFATLAEAPRDRLLELKRSPEGVDRLVAAWVELREALTFQPRPTWNGFSFDLFARLMGFAPEDPRMARLKGISQATWGGFAALSGEDGVGLDEAGRKKWACAILLERVDREIAGLEAHRQTLDLETIALDRSGAADVALFDPSREATLARRYEAEARRGFFKALKEFRQAEAEALERAEAAQEAEALASSCARPAPEPREPQPGAGMVPEWSRSGVEAVARGLDGRVVAVARGVGMAP